MTTFYSNIPNGRKVFINSNAVPLSGGTVGYYTPGTNTAQTTYSDYLGNTPNGNPLTLDSAGSCSVYATGQLREIVKDSSGNTISDAVVSASPVSAAMLPVVQASTTASAMTALGISSAMQPILAQSTATGAFSALASGGGTVSANLNVSGTVSAQNFYGGSLQMNPSNQAITCFPTANATSTLTSLNLQAATATGNANSREFLANLGLTSNKGNGGSVGNDKVVLYAGLDAQSGTADVWTANTCLTMESGSGSYNAQGIEVDLNNLNAHRGDGGLSAGLNAPIAVNLSLTTGPQSTFRTTAGMLIVSNQLNGGTSSQGTMNRGIVTAGIYNQAVFQDVSANTPIGVQLTGNYSVAAVDTSVSASNVSLYQNNNQVLAWKFGSTPVSDTVDSGGNRLVGSGSTSVKILNTLLPYSTTINCGSTALPWQTLYTATGTVSSSDPAKKDNIQPLQDMREVVKAIQPISYIWKDPDLHQRPNFGFDATQVKAALDALGHQDYAVHEVGEDGSQGLRHEQMIAVVWQALKDTLGVVEALRQDVLLLKSAKGG